MKILKQILIIFSVCMAGEILSQFLPFPFPSSVLSLLLLLLFLITHRIKPESIKETAEFFLGNMAFFFIPAGVAIMEKYELLKGNILSLLLVCVITTFLTFSATAFTVTGVMHFMEKRRKKEDE